MSVTFHSPQASLGNFHVMAFVDRLLGLTVNMFEKLSSWWKKKLKREPPYIWNSMLNCKYVLRMQRPPLLIELHAQQWQPEKVESLKINVILSLQRSYSTLPLNSIYLHKIEFAFNAQEQVNEERSDCRCSESDAGCLIGQAELPRDLAGSPKLWHCDSSHLGHCCNWSLINRFSRNELIDEQWLRQWMDRVAMSVTHQFGKRKPTQF